MPDGTQSYASQALNGLSFSNIVVSETDTGSVLPFNADPLPSVGTTATDGFSGIEFSSFLSGAIFAGSSISLHFTYDVTATAPGLAITALQQGFVPNAIIGDVTMTIVEKVYDANNTFQDPSGTYYGGDLLLGSAYSALHVDVTVVASVAASNTQTAFVDFSELQQGFATTHVLAAVSPGLLSGHVFLDGNADGAQGAADANLAGITVQLLDSAGNPVAGQVATTDANGSYRFTGLAAGSYAVQVTAPAGDSFSPAGTDANATVDSIVNAAGRTAPVAVVGGAETKNQNAGLYVPATFTAHVYNDASKDGLQGGSEAGQAGVTVQLLTGAGVATGQTAVTDANGNATFSGLVPGSYQIAVVTPAGETVTQSSNVAIATTLSSGQAGSATLGLFTPGTLSGHVFLDGNANGVQEAGDTNLAGITVQLLDGTGAAIAGQVATTDANGFYRFTGLVAGSYAVQVAAPAGDKFSQAGTNANAALDSIVNAAGQTAPIVVVAGAETLNQNAAAYAPATFTAHVYNDANNDGVQDGGEAGQIGITVQLLNGAGVATGQTAVTDADGNVSFTGLLPGSYQVAVAAPGGTKVTQASNVGSPVTLASGGTAAATEGLFTPGALSGHVFLDANADGVQQAGDTNLSGITVQLLDGTGAVIAGRTATTDASGSYAFTGLVAGSYAVQVTAPAGDKFSQTGTNANAALDSVVNAAGRTAPVQVAAGATTVNQNAAVYAPATFTAHVYNDANKDGAQGAGESGQAGVTVQLLTGAGVAPRPTAVPAANGNLSIPRRQPRPGPAATRSRSSPRLAEPLPRAATSAPRPPWPPARPAAPRSDCSRPVR